MNRTLGFVALALLGWCTAPALAGETEARDFTTFIDGKHAGNFHMTIEQRADGTLIMNANADVKMRFLVVTYRYSYRGTEIWKNGRLQSFESFCNDDGKKYHVQAQTTGKVVNVEANSQRNAVHTDVWITSFWKLPPAQFRNQAVPLLDGDTGKPINGHLQLIDVNRIKVAGQMLDCTHYRVTGTGPVDLWFDDQERLVRREWVDDGHRVILEIARIQK